MTIHIADPKTDGMARELARLMKTTLTNVVRISLVEALERHKAERGIARDTKSGGGRSSKSSDRSRR